MGGCAWLRALLATGSGDGESELATVLGSRPLGEHGLRMVLVIGVYLGLGAVPLWPVVSASADRLVLVARFSLGAIMGDVAFQHGYLWLGAAAPGSRIYALRRFRVQRPSGHSRFQLWSRAGVVQLHFIAVLL